MEESHFTATLCLKLPAGYFRPALAKRLGKWHSSMLTKRGCKHCFSHLGQVSLNVSAMPLHESLSGGLVPAGPRALGAQALLLRSPGAPCRRLGASASSSLLPTWGNCSLRAPQILCQETRITMTSYGRVFCFTGVCKKHP